jgi:Uma2 family endonuclease
MATLPADAVAVSRHRLTVADFQRMGEAGILGPDDRVELIAGEIIDMSPIGSLHAALVDRVAGLFHGHCGSRAIVRVQNPLALDDTSQPQPDVAVVRPRADFYAAAHPGPADTLLVIEVADTTLPFDLEVKVPLYAAAGIPEVWVIEAATRRTHVFRRPAGGRYEERHVVEPRDEVSCGGSLTGREALTGITIMPGSLVPVPPTLGDPPAPPAAR